MILRKPYALFIKSFKLLHLVLAVGMSYLFYRTTLILNFFGEAISQPGFNLSRTLNIALFDVYFYLIPIAVLVLTGLIMGVLIYKQKPFKFYVFVLAAFLAVLAFNSYLGSYLYEMEIRSMTAQSLSLMRDFTLISLLVQLVILVKYYITGIGFDIKQFDFSSDLADMAIEEADKEEFEVNLEVDFHSIKRKLKNWGQEFKYFYYENKFFVITGVVLVTFVATGSVYSLIAGARLDLREGDLFSASNVSLRVEESYITQKDYRGGMITEDGFILFVNAEISSRYQSAEQVARSQFRVTVGNYSFYHDHRYGNALSDFGEIFFDQTVQEATNYLFAFKMPLEFMDRQISFDYVDTYGDLITGEGVYEVLLDPVNIDGEITSLKTRKGERMYFDRPLLHSYAQFNDYELSENYALNYRFCIREDSCFTSKEYLTPTYTTNYDLVLLRLDGSFVLADNLDHMNINLAQFLQRFAFLQYEVNGELKTHRFDNIVRPLRTRTNDYFLEVPKEAMQSSTLEIIVALRGHHYEYQLK